MNQWIKALLYGALGGAVVGLFISIVIIFVHVVYTNQVLAPKPPAPQGGKLNVGDKLIFDADLPQPYLSIDDEKGGDICYYYDGKRQWCMPKHPEDYIR